MIETDLWKSNRGRSNSDIRAFDDGHVDERIQREREREREAGFVLGIYFILFFISPEAWCSCVGVFGWPVSSRRFRSFSFVGPTYYYYYYYDIKSVIIYEYQL